MILGFTWLHEHNPEIDFCAGTVKMTRCLPHCCAGCQAERKEEQNEKKEDVQRINFCRTGPLPTFVEDADDEEDEPAPEPPQPSDLDPETFPDEPLEEGDRIWATGLFPQAEHIQATSTISQRLAEGFRQNSQPTDSSKHIPPYLCDFSSVFSKDSFDELPESEVFTVPRLIHME